MTDNVQPTPLAKIFRIKELRGRIAKWLDVPPNRLGIAIYPDGAVRTFPPGKQLALSIARRLGGQGAGLRAGYLPGEPFTAWLRAGNLLSGDGELLDASLLCQVRVSDPRRFFENIVIPAGEIAGQGLDLSSAEHVEALGDLCRRYAADDLVQGLPTATLLTAIQTRLEALPGENGLNILGIQALAFRKTADQAEIAEKAQALQERLQDVELQKKMAALETQAQWDEFVRQVAPELAEKGGLRLAAAPAEAAAPPAQATAGEKKAPAPLAERLASLRQWIAADAKGQAKRRPWLIERLLGGKKNATEKEVELPHRRPAAPRWWLSRTIWMVFILVVTYLLSRLVFGISKTFGWEDPWEVLSVLWVSALGILIESVKVLYEKREEIKEHDWSTRGVTLLDQLTGNNRQRIDTLVRQQCSGNLAHTQQILNDLRSRVYRAGQEDLALRLRSLEGEFTGASKAVMDPKVGHAPYLDNLKLSHKAWEFMLDYDEELLIRTMALVEDARDIQKGYTNQQLKEEWVDKLQSRLDAFKNRFENRSRALQATVEEQNPYRMSDFQSK